MQRNFPTSGQFEVVGVELDGKNNPTMELTITDGIKDAVQPNDEDVTFSVSNSRIKYHVEDIYAYYDCFAEGTQICMADGTIKAIENIRQGDVVKTKTDETARVAEISMLEECQVINLVMRSGEKRMNTTARLADPVGLLSSS